MRPAQTFYPTGKPLTPCPVFEVVLEETTSGFEHSFARLETAIRSVLPALTDPSARETGRMTALSRMLPLENALSSLRLRVRRVNAILEQLLESTDDIEGLCGLGVGGEPRRAGGAGGIDVAGGGGGRGGGSGGVCTEADYALTEIAIEAYGALRLPARPGASRPRLTARAPCVPPPVPLHLPCARRSAPLPPAASPAFSYSSRLEFLADQVDSLTDFIGTARNSLEIALDSERNRMARLEL